MKSLVLGHRVLVFVGISLEREICLAEFIGCFCQEWPVVAESVYIIVDFGVSRVEEGKFEPAGSIGAQGLAFEGCMPLIQASKCMLAVAAISVHKAVIGRQRCAGSLRTLLVCRYKSQRAATGLKTCWPLSALRVADQAVLISSCKRVGTSFIASSGKERRGISGSKTRLNTSERALREL